MKLVQHWQMAGWVSGPSGKLSWVRAAWLMTVLLSDEHLWIDWSYWIGLVERLYATATITA